MQQVFGMEEAIPSPASAPTLVAPKNSAAQRQGRCEKYLADIRGVANFKDSYDHMNNKLKTKCKICGVFLTKKHQFGKKIEYY